MKKKEVLGNLANKGREYQHKGEPTRVDVHDFPDPKLGKAIPYGVFDLAAKGAPQDYLYDIRSESKRFRTRGVILRAAS